MYYAYLWLREDGTPYYVGKGKGDRAFHRFTRGVHPPKDRSRVLLLDRSNEAEAFKTEIELITNWGRLDLGTGCLHNRTDGGEGPSGRRHSPASRLKMSIAKKGKPNGHLGKTYPAISVAKMGHKMHPRTKALLLVANVGKPGHRLRKTNSQEHRANLKLAWIRRRQKWGKSGTSRRSIQAPEEN